MLTLNPAEMPVPKVHGYLLSAIAPRPIAFASTVDEDGRPNLAPFSFFNVFSANPPVLIFSPARRGTNNTTKHTYENVNAHPEVVINIVDYAMVQQCSLASTEYPEGVSEFEKTGLTPLESEVVKPFRVKESPVQLECKVTDVQELGSEGGAGNLVICEVVRIHIQDRVLTPEGKIDPLKMDQVGRCGGIYYNRVDANSLFEIPKPLATVGMGVDKLPEDVRLSKVLTGNDLAALATFAELPDETDVNEYKLVELADLFIEHEDEPHVLEAKLHEMAREHVANNQLEEAWKTLLTFNNG